MAVTKAKKAVKKRPANKKTGNPEMAARLVLTRKQAGMTQVQFANEMNVKLSHLKALENCHYQMSLDFIMKWKEIFKKSYQWIFEGDV